MVWDVAAAVGLAAIAATAVLGGAPAPAARTTALAAGLVVAGVVLDPVRRRGVAATVRAGLVPGLPAALVAWLAGAVAGRALVVAVAVGSLGLAAAAGARLALAALGAPARARVAVLVALALAGSAPLWAGPLVERAGDGPAAVLVAASPASYLAAAAGHDYLREPGLYALSPLGSLRFAYPGVVAATAGWLAVAGACAAAEGLWHRHRTRRSA